MATYNGTPIPSGFVQTEYKDQMASALAGQLVSASDINLTDSDLVDEADGILCGLGVVSSVNTSALRPGVNDTKISLPSGSETADDFAGIVVRSQSAFSTESKDAYAKDNFGAVILAAIRVGGRMWAKVFSGSATAGGTPYWRIKADVTTETASPIGGLCGSAIAGVTAVLHQDSTANGLIVALGAKADLANQPSQVNLEHRMLAATTSSTTFKVRAGTSAAGTVTFNGASSARLFGGVYTSTLLIEEIVA